MGPRGFFKKNPTFNCTTFLTIGVIKSRIFNSKLSVKKISHFNLGVFLILLWSWKGCPNPVLLRYLVSSKLLSELRSRPIFGGSGSDPSKIKRLRLRLRPFKIKRLRLRLRLQLRLRLRLQVNCKIENYEFVTIKKNLFSWFLPWYKITKFTYSTLRTTGHWG